MDVSVPVCLLGLLLSAVSIWPAWGEECTRVEGQPACVCKTSQGTLDLTPLSTNGSASFDGVADQNGQTYSYNPCAPYTDGGCKNSYICQWDDANPQRHSIANGGEKIHGNSSEGFYISYTSTNELIQSVQVSLECKQGQYAATFIAIGDTNGAGAYRFQLQSCHACLGGCIKVKHGNVIGIAGLVIMVVVVLALVGYCVIGAIVKKVRYEATGKDLIPNKDFWELLPVLLKEGCLFTISPCQKLVKRKDGYSKM